MSEWWWGPYRNQIYVFFPAVGITILSSLRLRVPPGHLTYIKAKIKTQTMHRKCWYPQVASVYFLPTQAASLCSWAECVRGNVREHYVVVMEWDAEFTHQMCVPVGNVCACVCAASGLSSCQSGTCAGLLRLERCRPRKQLQVRKTILSYYYELIKQSQLKVHLSWSFWPNRNVFIQKFIKKVKHLHTFPQSLTNQGVSCIT